jgi:hypothetical protein
VLIGDSVAYNGRTYVVVGFTPMSVTPAEVQLRDPGTGRLFWVNWPPVMEGVERAALRLVQDKHDDRARRA